jgi:hypothetical protein
MRLPIQIAALHLSLRVNRRRGGRAHSHCGRCDPRDVEQSDMMAGSAIDLNEIASPQILDPCQVEGLHSGVSVPGALADLVNK